MVLISYTTISPSKLSINSTPATSILCACKNCSNVCTSGVLESISVRSENLSALSISHTPPANSGKALLRSISHASAGGFLERDGFLHEFDDDLPDDVVVSMMRTPPLSCACPPGDGTRPIEMRGGNSSVFRHPHLPVDAVQSSAAFFSASTILSYLASVSVSIVASVDGSNASSSVQRSG